jgi:5-amino-6-(5-phosphoribosylamino)uracil reductase
MSLTVIAKSSITIDGYMDKAGSGGGMPISSKEDVAAVAWLRVWCDAIMVGAETVRRDRPRLLARSEEAREARLASGRSADPIKCVVSRSGSFDLTNPFFTTGDVQKFVLGAEREVHGLPDGTSAPLGLDSVSKILEFLQGAGVERLLVEGGPSLIGSFLAEDLVDEYRVATSPLILGSAGHANLGGMGAAPAVGLNRVRVSGRDLLGDTSVVYLSMPGRTHEPILPRVGTTDPASLHHLVKD